MNPDQFISDESGDKTNRLDSLCSFLRTSWPRPINPRNIPASHIVNNLALRPKAAQSEQWLHTYGPYQNLLQSIQGGVEISAHGTNDPFDLGVFEVARTDALKVVKARDGTASHQLARYKREEDTVNACVLELIEGVTKREPTPSLATMYKYVSWKFTMSANSDLRRNKTLPEFDLKDRIDLTLQPSFELKRVMTT